MAILYLLHLLLLCLIPSLITAADSINQSQVINDGDTIVSSGGIFELGFFSPGSSTGRYVGIWYKNVSIQTVVWVANRNKAINDTSGKLMLNSTGNLVLLSQDEILVWSADLTGQVQDPILQLLDTGNLILRDGNNTSSSAVYLWQSFDYPSDTILPGMKMGKDLRTGLEWSLTSWSSPDDPSPGDFTWGMENFDFPELFGRKSSMKYSGSGPWNGLRFSGAPQQSPNGLLSFGLVSNQDEIYYIYQAINNSLLMRNVVNQTNYLMELSTWSAVAQSWNIILSVPKDSCDSYGLCGVYSKCQTAELPYCQCLKGFSPKFLDEWNTNDWSQGCVRDKPLNCGSDVGFIRYSGLKLPDSANTSVNSSFNLRECRSICLSNCSCMAYANSNISGGGSGCAMWFSDLIDMKELTEEGQDIYIRMPASEIGKDGLRAWKIVVVVLAIGTAAGMFAVAYYIFKTRTKLQEGTDDRVQDQGNIGPKDDLEFPSFDLATITKATNNFSVQNKLGEGGFGPVYKGTLVNGEEIAVKRLSSSSTQGVNEFKNEVILIANLQHRNLVKLLGCCIQGDERMLIYEYMPNRSLDAFIFDERRSKLLDWGKRFHIICGIARGLLYLHQDSRLRIIHRDLKASNVLLDDEMNPKISDFGLARMFGGDETEGNTKRIVGTYGYMAPEYAIDGLFSVKSDVFSFGILVLEIISGKRNRGLFHSDHNLVGHAWKLYLEGKSPELIDPCLVVAFPTSEVSRCIHIALLCLQDYAEDRPSMASIVVMLSSEGSLPLPKHPRFLADRNQWAGNSSSSGIESCSNEITVTLVGPR